MLTPNFDSTLVNEMKHAILCVDDEVDNVDALERLFRRKYKVFKATSGAEGLALLSKERVSVIISDQRMPEMSGVEMLAKSMKTHPDAIRILLTGYTDIDSVISAINSGQVYRYITKPWDPVDLANTVEKAVEKYELRSELSEKNAALKAALEELQSLDQAKNHFMVLINHELKTPLTVILSFLDLLKETELGTDQTKYVDRIDNSAQKLKKIVDDVLELVSAETGIKKLNKKKSSANSLLKGLDKEFLEAAESKEQNIVLDIEDFSVKADPEAIRAVLRRLVENAIKFGDKKSNIQIATHSHGGAARFSVINKGKPLDKKVIQKILQPFALDEDIMHHSQGLGLGLSLCQALLRQHESKLEFTFPKGQVEVSFELPEA